MHTLASVIDQDINAPVVLLHLGDHLSDGGGIAHVGRYSQGIRPLGGQGLDALGGAGHEGHPRAALREESGRRQPDSTRCASHNGDGICNVHRVTPRLVVMFRKFVRTRW